MYAGRTALTSADPLSSRYLRFLDGRPSVGEEEEREGV